MKIPKSIMNCCIAIDLDHVGKVGKYIYSCVLIDGVRGLLLFYIHAMPSRLENEE
jgi:hypothetical protein